MPIPEDLPEIPPALTAEEWQHRKRPQYYREQPCIRLFSDGRVMISEDEFRTIYAVGQAQGEDTLTSTDVVQLRDPATLAATIALANAALPDTDPRKITRQGLDAIQSIMEEYGVATEENNRAHRQLDALYALLPPEGT